MNMSESEKRKKVYSELYQIMKTAPKYTVPHYFLKQLGPVFILQTLLKQE